MPVSKVVYGDSTLIDLTADTVTASDLLEGITAHGADGEAIIGTYISPPVAYGNFTLNTSRTTVNVGFKARYLTVMVGSGPSAISTYNADLSTTQARYSGASTETTTYTMSSDSTNYRLHSVTDTGFTVNARSSSVTSVGCFYAIGYEQRPSSVVDLSTLNVVSSASNQTADKEITTKPNNLIVFGYTISGTTNRDLTDYITGATLISQFAYRTDNPYTKTGLFVTTGTSVTFKFTSGRYGYAYYELPTE